MVYDRPLSSYQFGKSRSGQNGSMRQSHITEIFPDLECFQPLSFPSLPLSSFSSPSISSLLHSSSLLSTKSDTSFVHPFLQGASLASSTWVIFTSSLSASHLLTSCFHHSFTLSFCCFLSVSLTFHSPTASVYLSFASFHFDSASFA